MCCLLAAVLLPVDRLQAGCLAGRARRGLRRKLGEAAYLIDSTGLRLSGMGSDWAHFSATARGAKVHVIYDADAERPVYAAVTAARVNDITAARTMPIEAGATYVFDLGYYDYAWWAELDAAGCRIVTRFRSSTPLDLIADPSSCSSAGSIRPSRSNTSSATAKTPCASRSPWR